MVLAQSVTIFDVYTPEMKMEPLLQIQKYVGRILEFYEKMLEQKPKKTRTLLVAESLVTRQIFSWIFKIQDP